MPHLNLSIGISLLSPSTHIFERPPGVPFQKIQFGNERGGRSVLSRLPELGIARILALLRSLILCLSVTRKLSTRGVFVRGGATCGPLHPLRGCPRAWALEWERWISLRWLFGDSNTVVSSRWGLGGLRHFSGALRPFRHSSRGLPSGSAIWC